MSTRLFIFDRFPMGEPEYQLALSRVSPRRRQKAESFARTRDRQLSVMAELLLWRAMGCAAHGLPTIVVGSYGKPRFADPTLPCFNLSHCQLAAACAVSDSEVGVDVEACDAYTPDTAEFVCSDAELAALQGNPERFALLWTRKESLLKCRGTGLDGDLRSLLPPPEELYMASVVSPKGYACSVCGADPSVAALKPTFLTFSELMQI